jgi:hypothetical protein
MPSLPGAKILLETASECLYLRICCHEDVRIGHIFSLLKKDVASGSDAGVVGRVRDDFG